MYSLASYKEQCYNLGSPNITAVKSPLKNLPKAGVSEKFEFSPLKTSPIKTKIESRDRKCKRKLIPSAETNEIATINSPTKKPKMEDIKEMLEKSNKQMMEFMKSIDKKLDEKMDQGFASLSTSISTLQQNMNANNEQMGNKIATLEDEFVKFQENVTKNALEAKNEIKESILPTVREVLPVVKNEIKNEVIESVSSAWKASLADKIREHERSLIVFGLKVSDTPLNDGKDFLENKLKMSENEVNKACLKHAVRLGKGDGNNPPGLLLTFAHPGERNFVLSFSKNLKGSNLKLEKHIPKLFQKEHKVFKKEAWKLKNIPGTNYQTQIIFDGYKMLLRYKERDTTTDKFQYVIHSEYFPPMDKAESEIVSSIKHPIGSKPTPVISRDLIEKSNTSFYVTGMTTERTESTFIELFKDFLDPSDKDAVVEIKLNRKDLATVYCKSWQDCSRIVNNRKDKKFQNDKITLTMFADVSPKS